MHNSHRDDGQVASPAGSGVLPSPVACLAARLAPPSAYLNSASFDILTAHVSHDGIAVSRVNGALSSSWNA